jgi:hypothetical protein
MRFFWGGALLHDSAWMALRGLLSQLRLQRRTGGMEWVVRKDRNHIFAMMPACKARGLTQCEQDIPSAFSGERGEIGGGEEGGERERVLIRCPPPAGPRLPCTRP